MSAGDRSGTPQHYYSSYCSYCVYFYGLDFYISYYYFYFYFYFYFCCYFNFDSCGSGSCSS